MTLIPTFCRSCKSTVDIPVSMEDDLGISLAFAKVGVICNGCAVTARRKHDELWDKPIARGNLNGKPKRKQHIKQPMADP